MDTLAVQCEVDVSTWERIASTLRQSTVRKPDGTEQRKAYGAFDLSRPTLYRSRNRLDAFPTCRVVLEFSGKVIHGHNIQGSELCARAALELVLDELQGRSGVSLHHLLERDARTGFLVCRLDVAFTFLGLRASEYVAQAARYVLPRRERTIFENGVHFRSAIRSELFYDKRAEVLSAIAKLPESHDESGELRPIDELLRTLPGAQPLADGRLAENAGLASAWELVKDGALRVEVRIRGSANISRALGLVIPGTKPPKYLPATVDRVVRDESTYKLLTSFLTQFTFDLGSDSAEALNRLRDAGYTGSQLLQLLGYRELELLLGADPLAYLALDLSPARRRLLRRGLNVSGLRGLNGGPALSPLVLKPEMLQAIRENTDNEGERESWQHRRSDWHNFWLRQRCDLEKQVAA